MTAISGECVKGMGWTEVIVVVVVMSSVIQVPSTERGPPPRLGPSR